MGSETSSIADKAIAAARNKLTDTVEQHEEPGPVSYKLRGRDPAPGSFEETFFNKLDGIMKRGQAVGMTIWDICGDADVSRATPDRWRDRPPLSILLVDKMEQAVVAAESAGRPYVSTDRKRPMRKKRS